MSVPRYARHRNLWEYTKMADEIIKELWEIKDRIAREHDYNLEALFAHLRTAKHTKGRQVVDLAAMRKTAGGKPSAGANDSQE